MGETSAIGWTDATWNAVIGCSHVSPGCEHCYAETMSTFRGWTKLPWTNQNAAANVILKPHRLLEPFKWHDPKMVFVNSLSDVFHPQIPQDYVDQMFAVMALARQHTFQVLTKRAPEMLAYLSDPQTPERVSAHMDRLMSENPKIPHIPHWQGWPLPNVWMGVSAEDQRRANERIPLLLQAPAALRFVSAEPLLGPIDFMRLEADYRRPLGQNRFSVGPAPRDTRFISATIGVWWDEGPAIASSKDGSTGGKIDWIIVGGESAGPPERRLVEQCSVGGKYRHDAMRDKKGAEWRCALCNETYLVPRERWGEPANPFSKEGNVPVYLGSCAEWVRSIRDACRLDGTAFFFKQWGGPTSHAGGNLLDGEKWEEIPPRQSLDLLTEIVKAGMDKSPALAQEELL